MPTPLEVQRDDAPLRRALDSLGRAAFVGREREFGELFAGLRKAGEGHGRLFMIVGEPGIGKSRLADELSTAARAMGALVLWGRCWEGGGAPAYWPWVQVLRGCCDDAGGALSVRLGASAAHVAQLVPEIHQRLAVAEPSSSDAERARFHLFDATARFLKSTAAERPPLVLILDDLHAADLPSLLLLQFVARDLADTSILILGCYRALEMRRHHESSEILGDVARHGRHVPLRGLSEIDVGRFITRTFGLAPAPSVVLAVHRATDGNPFFVDEVVRLLAVEDRLARGGDRLGIPDGVREAIRRRLAPLPPECAAMLAVAAVVGREFDLGCVERACELPAGRLFELIAEAVTAEIVEPVGDGLGRYRFAHALIRETLYDDLAPVRRIDLHGAVGRALERRYGNDREPYLAELAHHFLAAAPGGAVSRAVDYCTRAAERASRLLASEEAVVHYQRALEALAFAAPDDGRRCELLLALGEAHDRAGDLRSAKTTFARAAAIARSLGDGAALARAALGSGGQWAHKFTSGVFDKSDVGLLEEAYTATAGDDGAVRVKVLARLGLKLRYLGVRERSDALSHEAVELARRLGDLSTLACALTARHAVLLGPDHLDARLAIANEMLRLADETGDRELALRGHAVRMLDHLQMGDIAALDHDLDRHAALARATRDPFDLWLSAMCPAMRALWVGNLADGERAAMEAMATAWRMPGVQSLEENAGLSFGGQVFLVRREMGGGEELLPVLRHMIDRFPETAIVRCVLMMVLFDADQRPEARRHFEELAAQDFALIPRDSARSGLVALLAEASVLLGDRPRAEMLYALLLPYASQNASMGSTECVGAVARYLGLLAASLGRSSDARVHFEGALVMNARMGARSRLAHTQHDFALTLLAIGNESEHARAIALPGRRRRHRPRALHDAARGRGRARHARGSRLVTGSAACSPRGRTVRAAGERPAA